MFYSPLQTSLLRLQEVSFAISNFCIENPQGQEMAIDTGVHKPLLAALLTQPSAAAQNNDMIAAIECIVCDCAVAQAAFDSRDVFAALLGILTRSTSACTHAEVCRVMVALLRGRGSACRVWCDVAALSDGIRAVGDVVNAHSSEAAAELLNSLAVEMDTDVAGALHALGDLSVSVDRIAAAASSHWCRVVLLSAVRGCIVLAAAFRSSLCSNAVISAAQAAMLGANDDYECGTVANAVGELVRGHAANKAAFSCEATCAGLKRLAEAAVEQVKVRFHKHQCGV